jgi:hypothetical protein
MYIYVYTYIKLGEERKEKRMIHPTISKYIISVQIEDIMICTESCSVIADKRKRIRKSNRGG